MKRLLIALLLLAAPAWAEEPVQLARMSGPMLGAGGSATSCSAENDSTLWHPVTQPGNTSSTAIWTSLKIITSAQYTITGYKVRICDDTSSAGDIFVELMNHDAANDCPDETSVVASSASIIRADSTIAKDCDTSSVEEFILSSPIVLAAGTYWITIVTSASVKKTFWKGSTGDLSCYSANSGSSWSCVSNIAYDFELLGCE